MRVKCISYFPDEQQIKLFGESFACKESFDVTVGVEYLVLGVTFFRNSSCYGTGAYYDHISTGGYICWTPACLFEIVDGRTSRHWKACYYNNGSFRLGPAAFQRKYYHDLLSDGDPETVADFKQVVSLLEHEFDDE